MSQFRRARRKGTRRKGREIVLDPETRLEGYLTWAAFILVLGDLALVDAEDLRIYLWLLVPLTIATITLRLGLDERYVLDLDAGKLDFSRTLFGRESRRRVCGLGGIAAVAMYNQCNNTTEPPRFECGLALVTREGRILRVTDTDADRSAVIARGTALAGTLRVDFHEGSELQRLRVRRGPGGEPEIQYGIEPGYQNIHPLLAVAIVIGIFAGFGAWVYWLLSRI